MSLSIMVKTNDSITLTKQFKKLKNTIVEVQVNTKQSPIINVHIASYMVPWVNFCYYLLMVPFKIKDDGDAYYVSKNKLQRTLCGIMHPLIFIFGIAEIRGKLVGKVGNNPVLLGHAADRFITLFYCFVFYHLVWRNQSYFEVLLKNCIPKHNSKHTNRNVIIYCLYVLANSLLALIVMTNYLKISMLSNPWYEKILGYAELLCLDLGCVAPKDEQFSVAITILTLTGISLKFQKWFLMEMLGSFAVLFAFVAWRLCKRFYNLIQEDKNNEKWIIDAYTEVKEVMQRINDLVGSICIAVFGNMVTLTSIRLIEIVEAGSISSPFVFLFFVCLTSTTFVLASEANYKGSHFKTWLLEHRKNNISMAEYITAESCLEALAIKGNRFFTITYRFLGTAFSVVLTYSIIMVQFRANTNGSSL